MVSSNGTLANRLLVSKKHRNVSAGSRLQFWIKFANVSANHLASSCWEEPIIDKIGLSGILSLCVLGNPYIHDRCEPVGQTLS